MDPEKRPRLCHQFWFSVWDGRVVAHHLAPKAPRHPHIIIKLQQQKKSFAIASGRRFNSPFDTFITVAF
jgi:hypothetical protein